MTLKLKDVSSPPSAPFTFSTASSPAEATSSTSPPRPPADFLPERDMHMFGSNTLSGGDEKGRGLVRCKRCNKTVMEWAAGEHRRLCNHVLDGVPLTVKRGIKVDNGMGTGKKRRASDLSMTSNASPSKKKAKLPHLANGDESDDDDDLMRGVGVGGHRKETKKMQKEREKLEKKEAKEREKLEAAERKRLRAACPINLDRQCGVINDKGLPCSRSLTCKTHTVGAKRAVQDRTRSYDSLYLDWQRANNPNFKEPGSKKDPSKKLETGSNPSSFHGGNGGGGG
ncbi:hypothetical protein P7C73_g4450, partial [Tremellales sp. Uapishka_1]